MGCIGMDPRYPMIADIYIATGIQDNVSGMIIKEWSLLHADVQCELSSDKFNSDTRYAIQTKNDLFDMPLLLFGRFKQDIRKTDTGYAMLTDMLVTNIRDYCDKDQIFIEPSNNGEPMIFEIATLQPFTNPWGKTEYYKTQILRMDDQDLL